MVNLFAKKISFDLRNPFAYKLLHLGIYSFLYWALGQEPLAVEFDYESGVLRAMEIGWVDIDLPKSTQLVGVMMG